MKTVLHWREVFRWALVCLVIIPLLTGGLIWVAQMFTPVPAWAAVVLGLATGIISTHVYRSVRPPMWHFE